MKLRPVAASSFLKFNETAQNVLKLYGGIPTNDAFVEMWDLLWDLLLLYGGRGAGKSEAVPDLLLNECLNTEYFKCYYGRKVFDTVRQSSFATLTACIKKDNLEKYFSYSTAPNGSMIIECRGNGNLFIPFGADQVDKLKSIKDPTHIWCEEFDQFIFNDFKELFPTLRTIRGQNKFIGTFNAYSLLPNHWIMKVFFPEYYIPYDKTEVIDETILESKRVRKVFVNYTDNYFIDQKTYRESLWLSSAGNYGTFEGLANGAFGVMENDSPWAYAFSKEKHVSNGITIPHPSLNRQYPVYLSWDFNRNPMCCNVIQWYDDEVKVLEVIKIMKTGVDAVCERIKRDYYGCLYIVTGDYSGNTASSLYQEQVTHYSLIKHYLYLSDGQMGDIIPNPKLKENSTLVNTILAYYNVVIHATKAAPLVFDMENVKRVADGTIMKQNREDPAQQSDCFTGDTMVLTDGGLVRMDCIGIGSKVLTRNGHRSIIDKWDSIADVYEFEFTDGTKISCTKDHRFYTESLGFVPIFSIFKANLSVCHISLFTTAKNITNIGNKTIFIRLAKRVNTLSRCIGKCGLMYLVKYRKVMKFITKTKINLIIQLKILNVFQNWNTLKYINLANVHTDLRSANIAQMNLKLKNKEQDSVRIIANAHGEEKISRIYSQSIAKNAAKNSLHLNTYQEGTVHGLADQRITLTELKVKKVTYKGRQKVYDITVEDQHEFYANNILVHNCLDGFRYFCNAFLSWFKPENIQTYIRNVPAMKGINGTIKETDIIDIVLASLDRGDHIDCSKEQYINIRPAILEQAGKYVDVNDSTRAQLALMEVKRLDQLFVVT